jgi:hypothetical protein
MTDPVDDVAAGRAAWARIRGHDRKSWEDWVQVARGLAVGRVEMMKAANTNRPVGTTYNRKMGDWLRENGLDGITAQERYRLQRILENLTEVGTWRNGLDDATRRRLNHPNSIWSRFQRRKTEAERSAPVVRHHVAKPAMSHKNGARPVYWPQQCVRAAHAAMLKSQSHDLLVLARVALEAAIPSENVLIELLSPDTAAALTQPIATYRLPGLNGRRDV